MEDEEFTIEDFIRGFLDIKEPEEKADWIRVFDEMAVHTRKRKPEELLLSRRPNEWPEVYEYRLANYEAITYGSMNKALDDIYRMMSCLNFSVLGESEKLRQYLSTGKFTDESLSFQMYLMTHVLRRSIEDPNGLLVWLPGGKGLTTSAESIEPQPHLVYSSQIHFKSEDIISILSNEKSVLTEGKKKFKIGKVYWLLTDTLFVKLFQTGTVKNPKWDNEVVYQHDMGHIPAITLGGEFSADCFYESFFAPYLAFGNEAIRQFSDWQAIMLTSAFPYIEEFVYECEVRSPQLKESEKDSSGTHLSEEKYKAKTELQPIPRSPFGTRLRKVIAVEGMETILPAEVPSIRFIHPDPAVAKYSGEAWMFLLEKAEDSLNQRAVRHAQSGTAKEIDNQPKYGMNTKIGNNFFDNLYLTSLRLCEAYLTRSKYSDKIVINKPAVFQIKTEQQLVDELGTLKEKNVPGVFLAETTKDLAMKRFSGNPVSQKIFEVICTYDPLFIYTSTEKSELSLGGIIDKEKVTQSTVMHSVLQIIAYELTTEKFIAETLDKLYDAFLKKFKELYPPVVLTVLTDALGNPLNPAPAPAA